MAGFGHSVRINAPEQVTPAFAVMPALLIIHGLLLRIISASISATVQLWLSRGFLHTIAYHLLVLRVVQL